MKPKRIKKSVISEFVYSLETAECVVRLDRLDGEFRKRLGKELCSIDELDTLRMNLCDEITETRCYIQQLQTAQAIRPSIKRRSQIWARSHRRQQRDYQDFGVALKDEIEICEEHLRSLSIPVNRSESVGTWISLDDVNVELDVLNLCCEWFDCKPMDGFLHSKCVEQIVLELKERLLYTKEDYVDVSTPVQAVIVIGNDNQTILGNANKAKK